MCTTVLLSRVSDFGECPLSQGSTVFKVQPRYRCETHKQSLGGEGGKGGLLCCFSGSPRSWPRPPGARSLAGKGGRSGRFGTAEAQAPNPLEVNASQWTPGI